MFMWHSVPHNCYIYLLLNKSQQSTPQPLAATWPIQLLKLQFPLAHLIVLISSRYKNEYQKSDL